jgi:hypothetical protein
MPCEVILAIFFAKRRPTSLPHPTPVRLLLEDARLLESWAGRGFTCAYERCSRWPASSPCSRRRRLAGNPCGRGCPAAADRDAGLVAEDFRSRGLLPQPRPRVRRRVPREPRRVRREPACLGWPSTPATIRPGSQGDVPRAEPGDSRRSTRASLTRHRWSASSAATPPAGGPSPARRLPDRVPRLRACVSAARSSERGVDPVRAAATPRPPTRLQDDGARGLPVQKDACRAAITCAWSSAALTATPASR